MIRKVFSAFGSFLGTPYGIVAVIVVVWHLAQWALSIPINPIVSIATLVVDGLATLILISYLIYFFAQFILPIHKPEERQEIYSRVRDFDSGERGPILFVKNGRVIEHEGEINKKGPGVIVLDTASAVVLRTDAEIVGAVGPGVRFTSKDEYIIKDLNPKTNQMESIGVDLRTQWRYLGPSASKQPFLNPVPVNDPKKFNEIEKLRKQTAGLTRDGFEVSAYISIKFRVKRADNNNQPTQSDVLTRFVYDSESVTKAVTREVVELNKEKNKKTRVKWKELPEHLVINLWREYIRKIKLEDLFTDTEAFSNLQNIEYKINQHLTKARVNPLDDIGSPGGAGRQMPSREYAELEARGLEIIDVRIHHVMFEKELEDKIVAQWTNDWLRVAQREEDLIKEKAALSETSSRNEALKRFARVATQKFAETLAKPIDAYSTLQDLVEPLKENLLPQTHADNQVEPVLEKLDEILKKLLVLKHDQARRHEEGNP